MTIAMFLNSTIGKIVIITFLGLLITILTGMVIANSKKEKDDPNELTDVAASEEETIVKLKVMSHIKIEEIFIKLLPGGVCNTNIIIQRIIFLVAAILTYNILGWVSLYLVGEIMLILYKKVKTKQLEDDIGITYVDEFSRFLDMYIPSIQSGVSVDQTMMKYINTCTQPEILEWWYGDRKKIPHKFEKICKMYESGKYNEENGYQDSSDEFQRDLRQQVKYFNLYKEKMGETKSIQYCLYVALPIMLVMSYNTQPIFWNGMGGIFTALGVLVAFGVFIFLTSNLEKSTCHKLF